MGVHIRSTRVCSSTVDWEIWSESIRIASTMSSLQSQLLLAGAALMACLMLAQSAPALVHPHAGLSHLGLVHPFGLGVHPGLVHGVHPGFVHPGLLLKHPVKDANNDGVADILDLNLDGKVDHPLPLYPINEKLPALDENNDRIPDEL